MAMIHILMNKNYYQSASSMLGIRNKYIFLFGDTWYNVL